MNTNFKLFGMFLAGATAGAISAYLTAPQKGKKTRKQLKKEAHKIVDSVEKEMNNRFNTLKKEYNKNLEQLAKNGHHLVDETKQIVSAN